MPVLFRQFFDNYIGVITDMAKTGTIAGQQRICTKRLTPRIDDRSALDAPAYDRSQYTGSAICPRS
jgi:hypothetical protein